MANTINELIAAGRYQLTEPEAKALVQAAGIPVVKTLLCHSAREAAQAALSIGYPVAMKVVSTDIIHKSDIGGVVLNIENANSLTRAYRDIMKTVKAKQPSAVINGVAVQAMAGKGTEVIVGVTKDPQFGPVIMFGLGGILVELLKDISFRIVPINRRDATEMIQEIKGFPLLNGYRGQPAADLVALENIILKVAALVETRPEIRELDLNPIIVDAEGAVVVDARVTLEKM
jgi:acetyl-CoA synthetase (ADP-forming)